jgi:mycoredoxin
VLDSLRHATDPVHAETRLDPAVVRDRPGFREDSPQVHRLHTSVTTAPDPTTSALPPITVYWRPGCPFCSRLFRQLSDHGIEHTRVDIWEEPEGAAVVRSIARGNETVPTVMVGSVGLVNPSASEILAAVQQQQ